MHFFPLKKYDSVGATPPTVRSSGSLSSYVGYRLDRVPERDTKLRALLTDVSHAAFASCGAGMAGVDEA